MDYPHLSSLTKLKKNNTDCDTTFFCQYYDGMSLNATITNLYYDWVSFESMNPEFVHFLGFLPSKINYITDEKGSISRVGGISTSIVHDLAQLQVSLHTTSVDQLQHQL